MIADLGAGGGLPGLVLAAALPDARVVLVESRQPQVRVHPRRGRGDGAARTSRSRARARRSGTTARARATSSRARALAALPVLYEYAAPLLRDGGVLVAWKGEVAEDEAADGAAAATLLGLEEAPAARGAPFAGSERRTLARRSQDRAHAAALPAPARHCNETPAVCQKPALKARQYRVSGPDPPSRAASVGDRMSTVYAIANQKGGVGKTTTAVNVAACIAEAGFDTLLVDVDPQGNATVGLGADRSEGVGLYDVLSGDVARRGRVRATSVERLSLLASTPDLAGATMELPRLPGSERRLRDALAPLRDRYAYVAARLPAVARARSRSTRWSPPTA